ncbi:F0F1 ATP synthase subunit A [Candidatus Roizmanbacteria bacterium]|jgi:F-type H+-transporting ATPase subunit a|nr:F0F1 ATP synthase subunit A [Candidatus Roizmanbacteria bacterium]
MHKPHISLKAEEVFRLFHFPFTNSYLSSLIVVFFFILVAVYYKNQSTKPLKEKSLVFFFINFINNALYGFFYSILGEQTKIFYPVLGAFFLYILLQNWFGLLPGVGSLLVKVGHGEEHHMIPLFRGGTADLNATLGLAMISVGITQYFSVKILGFKGYIRRFYNLKDPMTLFIGTLEIVSEFSKVLSFSFRLFGNIFAGEVLLSVIAFLIPILASLPFLALEIFVGFIQAVVFATLTSVFISLAVVKHH